MQTDKINPVTIYDLTELDYLLCEHENDFLTKSITKQWAIIIGIGILCDTITLQPI